MNKGLKRARTGVPGRQEASQVHADVADPIDWDQIIFNRFGSSSCSVMDVAMDDYSIEALIGLAHTLRSERAYEDEGEGGTNANAREHNPLLGLGGPPLPPSVLDSLIPTFEQADTLLLPPSLDEAFDDSALVAIGMIWEEILTASLLPLANAHCQRCRQLMVEQESSLKSSSKHEYDRTLAEWTIPPEEALLKIALRRGQKENEKDLFPNTASAPARVLKPRDDDSDSDMDLDNTDLNGAPTISQWRRAHRIRKETLNENLDVFRLFLSDKQAPGGETDEDIEEEMNSGENESEEEDEDVD